jgi:hypothetical protein
VAADTLVVDPQVYFHEHWQTILIGLLFVAEGSKQIVRWAMWIPPLPLFGIATNPTTFAAYSMVLGSLLMFTGYLFLRLKRVGVWLGIGIAALMAVSTTMSWNQWHDIARELLIPRPSHSIGRSRIPAGNPPRGAGRVPSPHDCRDVPCSEETTILSLPRHRNSLAARDGLVGKYTH